MAPLSLLIAFTLAPVALGRRRALIASATNPVETVIKLLQGLKMKVAFEGETEAATYDEFACFCKKTTKEKSTSIQKGTTSIDALSSSVARKTAIKEDTILKLKNAVETNEQLQTDLKETTERCAAEKATYLATDADLSSAIYGLEQAKRSLESAKPASFIEMGQLRDTAKRSASLDDPDIRAIGELLQQQAAVDPSDPEFKFSSQGIIDTISKLNKLFSSKKKEVNDEWDKTEKTCKSTIKGLKTKIGENEMKMALLASKIEKTKAEIAKDREDLLNDEDQLKDDQQYMKDLTMRCEARAKDWDQRSKLRGEELEAFTKALALLENKVKEMDTAANQRVVEKGNYAWKKGLDDEEEDETPPSFLQTSNIAAGTSHTATSEVTSAANRARQDEAVELLRSTASKAGSVALAMLAERVAADPFTKVKTLIQKLIERLLAEATAEVTKKSFCDTELAKARTNRDFRLAEARKLSVELAGLEAQHDALKAEISELEAAIKKAMKDLAKTTEIRQKEKDENLLAIKNAKAGFVAVTEAAAILRNFFTKASRATVLLQASPVDEDTTGAGFTGAYKGAQESSKAIMGMLEVIKSDFERTIRNTEKEEKASHEEFIEFERATLGDISGKSTKRDLDKQDLKTNIATTTSKMGDLQTASDLVDENLKTIEGLKPTCIDTGMSYKDRVAKREEEIEALKKAMAILTPTK